MKEFLLEIKNKETDKIILSTKKGETSTGAIIEFYKYANPIYKIISISEIVNKEIIN